MMWLLSCCVLASTVAFRSSPSRHLASTAPRCTDARRRPWALRATEEGDAVEDLLAQAAALRAEASVQETDLLQAAAAAAPATAAPPAPAKASAAENRAKIRSALRAATESKDKTQLQVALAAAEKAGFTAQDEAVAGAVAAFNAAKSGVSQEMRQRLMNEAAAGDPTRLDYDGGLKTYGAIFAIMSVLVIVGGKDIFF